MLNAFAFFQNVKALSGKREGVLKKMSAHFSTFFFPELLSQEKELTLRLDNYLKYKIHDGA